MNISFSITVGDLINTIILVILSAWLGYKFSISEYIRRKEIERIRQIYIKEGIQKLIGELNHASNICHLNFRRLMEFLTYYKLANEKFDQYDKELLLKIEGELRKASFLSIVPNLSLQITDAILGKDFPSEWVVDAIINYQEFNDYVTNYIPTKIKKYEALSPENKIKKDEFIELLIKEVQNKWDKCIKTSEPLVKQHLPNILLRTEELNPKNTSDIDKIKRDDGIRKILEEMKKDYLRVNKTSQESKT